MDQNIGNGFPYQGAGPFCQGPLDLTYKLEMTNGRNSWTRKHFSADEARHMPDPYLGQQRTLTRLPARPQIGVLQLYIWTTCILFVFSVQTFRIMRGLSRKKKCATLTLRSRASLSD